MPEFELPRAARPSCRCSKRRRPARCRSPWPSTVRPAQGRRGRRVCRAQPSASSSRRRRPPAAARGQVAAPTSPAVTQTPVRVCRRGARAGAAVGADVPDAPDADRVASRAAGGADAARRPRAAADRPRSATVAPGRSRDDCRDEPALAIETPAPWWRSSRAVAALRGRGRGAGAADWLAAVASQRGARRRRRARGAVAARRRARRRRRQGPRASRRSPCGSARAPTCCRCAPARRSRA